MFLDIDDEFDIFVGFRAQLEVDIDTDRERYFEINSYRNPFRNVEYLIVPLIVAFASFVIAKTVDMTCSTDFCEVEIFSRTCVLIERRTCEFISWVVGFVLYLKSYDVLLVI